MNPVICTIQLLVPATPGQALGCRINPAFPGLDCPASDEAAVPAATGTPHSCGSLLRQELPTHSPAPNAGASPLSDGNLPYSSRNRALLHGHAFGSRTKAALTGLFSV